jgi:hypothetical protein
MKVEFGCHRSWVELRRSSAFKKLEGHKNEIDPANAGMFRFQEEDRDNCWCKMICHIHITKAEGFCGKLFREIGDGCRFEEVGTKFTMGKGQLGLHPKLVPRSTLKRRNKSFDAGLKRIHLQGLLRSSGQLSGIKRHLPFPTDVQVCIADSLRVIR